MGKNSHFVRAFLLLAFMTWDAICLQPVPTIFNLSRKENIRALIGKYGTVAASEHAETSLSLTAAEESQLSVSLSQALAWMITWNPTPLNCPNGKSGIIDLATLCKRYAGNVVRIHLEIRHTSVSVYVAQMHSIITFRRLSHFGLAPPSIEWVCADDYEELLAWRHEQSEKRKNPSRTIHEAVEKARREDPQLGPFFDTLDNSQSESIQANRAFRHEARDFSFPELCDHKMKPSRSAEKENLYQRILQLVRNEVVRYQCIPKTTFEVMVPDFELGDPEINVLAEPNRRQSETIIVLIGFDRDSSNGAYRAYFKKAISSPDIVEYTRPIVKRNQYRSLKLNCY